MFSFKITGSGNVLGNVFIQNHRKIFHFRNIRRFIVFLQISYIVQITLTEIWWENQENDMAKPFGFTFFLPKIRSDVQAVSTCCSNIFIKKYNYSIIIILPECFYQKKNVQTKMMSFIYTQCITCQSCITA